MPLNRRQKRLYTYRVNLYAPVDGETGVFANDRYYDITTPTFANVACAYFNTDEYAPVTVIGRTNRSNLEVIDKFHFAEDDFTPARQVENGFLVKMLTPGSTFGYYWILQGNAKTRRTVGRRRANVAEVYAYRTPEPYGKP